MTPLRPSFALLLVLSACHAAAEAPAGPPVILISLDTLRADRLGAYGNADGLSPNLDNFASSAVVFDHAWAQANQTNLSHASLFTSRYPSELGAIENAFLPSPSIPTLAEVLGHYGYGTAGYTSGAHLTRGFGLERGFQTWETPQELGSLYHTVGPALAWLDARTDTAPYLLFVHSYDTHQRYLKPAPVGLAWTTPGYQGPASEAARNPLGTSFIVDGQQFQPQGVPPVEGDHLRCHDEAAKAEIAAAGRAKGTRPIGPKDEAWLRGVYDGSVAYADGWFGDLMAELDKRGVLDKAVVVVLSDHGESLGENGLWGHSWSLTDADLHVPLIVRLPGGRDGGRHVTEQVALLDVLPTILDLAGAQAPAGIHGHSLRPALEGKAAPSEPYIFSEGAHRLLSVRSATQRGTFAGVDPNSPFLTDLLRFAAVDGPAWSDSTVGPTERPALRDAMVDWRGTLSPAPVFAHADPGLVKALHERGYWEAQ